MTLYPKLIMDALATVTYAGTKKNLVDSEMVADTPSVAAPSQEGEPWKVKVVLVFPSNLSGRTAVTTRSPTISVATAYRISGEHIW